MTTILSPHPGAHAAPLPDRHAAARRALRRAFRLRARAGRRPGSAGLPAIDPAVVAHMRAVLAETREAAS